MEIHCLIISLRWISRSEEDVRPSRKKSMEVNLPALLGNYDRQGKRGSFFSKKEIISHFPLPVGRSVIIS